MCFSPEASFITAALTGAVGVASLSRARSAREIPLAAMPVFFALQQTLEGLLWLALPAASAPAITALLTFAFLVFALGFWPIYAALSVLLMEPAGWRRTLILPWLGLGFALSVYLVWGILARTPEAAIRDGHIVYATHQTHVMPLAVAYVAAVTMPLLLSSLRTGVVLGTIMLVGCLTAYLAYRQMFLSVWCFFAAAASVAVFWQFAVSGRQPAVAAARP